MIYKNITKTTAAMKQNFVPVSFQL